LQSGATLQSALIRALNSQFATTLRMPARSFGRSVNTGSRSAAIDIHRIGRFIWAVAYVAAQTRESATEKKILDLALFRARIALDFQLIPTATWPQRATPHFT
jgi:hypothetical protein